MPTRLLLALGCVLAGVTAAGLALFGLPAIAAQVAALCGLLAPVCALRWPRALAVGAWLAASAALWWVPLHAYADRVDELTATLDRGGPAALSHRDLAGIWALHLAMATVGAPAFPEVALETGLLIGPNPAVRRFDSGFAMRSEAVSSRVADLQRQCARLSGPADLPARRITFSYARSYGEARVGLALNPFELRAHATPGPSGCARLDLTGRVPVSYPRRAFLHLFTARGRAIGVQEGLYWALQQRGWLHPYTAEWRWSVGGDAPS